MAAYVEPDADAVRARFPVFDDVDDEVIEPLIAEALRKVDDTWFDEDRAPAVMYLVAHMLVTEGALDSAVASSPGPVQSESLGDASVSYGNRAGSSAISSTDYSRTEYGMRYLDLLRRSHGGMFTI